MENIFSKKIFGGDNNIVNNNFFNIQSMIEICAAMCPGDSLVRTMLNI